MRLPGRTRMFPGCGSPWKSPSSKSCRKAASMMFRATCSRSKPASAVTSETFTPSTNSRVRTVAEERASWTRGMTRNGRGRRRLGHRLRVPGLDREVQLLLDGPLELLDHAGRRVDAGLLDHRLEQLREVVEQREVRLDLLADARPLHLHHHLLAAVGGGAVDLRDGGARERHLVERGEAAPRPCARGRARSRSRISRERRPAARRPAATRAPRSSGRGGGPGREERIWPSLMKVGPSSPSICRKRAAVPRSAAAAARASPAAPRRAPSTSRRRIRSRYAPKPWRAMAAAIWRSRFRSWKARAEHDRATLAPGSRGRHDRAPRTPACGRTRSPMPEIAQAHTPMMRQYLETKARYPDAILFFRLGDFYEMFFEDAVQASEALQITLTARSKGDDKVPMCGVPYHAARGYVAKLLEQGFKVAICDQVEEPGKSALVRREVTRVVTPGTVLDDQVLDPREASFLGAVAFGERGGGLALLDASTGELAVRRGGRRRAARGRAPPRRRARAALRAAPRTRPAWTRWRGRWARRRPGATTPTSRAARSGCARHLGVATLDGFGVAACRSGSPRRRPRSRTWWRRSGRRRATWTGSRASPPTTSSCSTRRPAPTSSSSAPSRAAGGRGRCWR